ncbi:YdeI/OmpD-associated family protein [Leptolyngbya sp. FACHB-17]|uniref:YdeI/OmpD-associated family protein n=1 Tax=unclassified Leptolyngbya TaxID=2650499 RepID=UPI00168093E9|nr:YdeI/OmpD-associated family protein [Leptolyngbya sp. FACHB-17]MBD2079971.1 YdeI/OmpD-associated family protein [Leptolyngbya sp. FACHB-17]
MSKFEDQLDRIEAIDRAAWRNWLLQNHQSAIGVWLIYYKVKSGKPSVWYSEAVKEALCFGWIDSKTKSLDNDRYMQIFTPRKPKSVWSKLNKQYIEELIAQGLMTPAGLQKIEAAKQDGSWTSLDAIEALMIPPDLAAALGRNAIAQQNFEAFSNSTKKPILYWIDSAKRLETRRTRIEKTVQCAVQNQSPLTRSPK